MLRQCARVAACVRRQPLRDGGLSLGPRVVVARPDEIVRLLLGDLFLGRVLGQLRQHAQHACRHSPALFEDLLQPAQAHVVGCARLRAVVCGSAVSSSGAVARGGVPAAPAAFLMLRMAMPQKNGGKGR